MEKAPIQRTEDIKVLTAGLDDKAKRLDIFVAESIGITRSQVQKLIRERLISVNGNEEDPGYRVRQADTVKIVIPKKSDETLVPENLLLKIFFMDDYLAVVDKPAGMVVYPSAGHTGGTLMNALAHYAPKLASIGGGLRPGVVHRLDKDTSGVMVVALDDITYYDLIDQFKERTIQRKYVALVSARLKEDSGEIKLAIGRSDTDRKKMSTRTRRGKEAMTRWKVLRRLNKATLIEARLGTGRTHQIRVHFAAIGHPVLGDNTYGKINIVEMPGNKVVIPRQMLHAETLGFIHPHTRQLLEFTSPVPDDMKECIEILS
jgi:23S rRNA pseudouridine1911/1915/1917 synthase